MDERLIHDKLDAIEGKIDVLIEKNGINMGKIDSHTRQLATIWSFLIAVSAAVVTGMFKLLPFGK